MRKKKQISELINQWIKADYQVDKQVLAKEEALKQGAIALFIDKYPDVVNMYSIGPNPQGQQKGSDYVSRELCSGPHVAHTGLIDQIVLTKETAVADGVRRIYAVQQKS